MIRGRRKTMKRCRKHKEDQKDEDNGNRRKPGIHGALGETRKKKREKKKP